MSDAVVSLDALNDIIEDTPFLRAYRTRVERCALGECEVVLPYSEDLERPDGLISGMSIMGLADVAMWLAIMTSRGMDERWVTSDMASGFLRGGRAEDIVCSARLLRIGSRSIYGVAECRGMSSGDLLSHHSMRWAKVTGDPAS
jgi:acyl-coenzyme A thioesterase PaaI-like protein